MSETLITSSTGVLTVLVGICAFFFWLERFTKWKLFNYLPPLLFIYFSPVLLSNYSFIPVQSEAYNWIRQNLLPMMLVILLLDIDVKGAVKVMGKGMLVMLMGTLGVVIGAPIAYLFVKSNLGPEGWKAFGTLAGSWIGGTGNMGAMVEVFDTQGQEYGLAVLADTMVYIVWLPIMLGSKNLAKWFNKFANVDPNRIQEMEKAAKEMESDKGRVETIHYFYLFFIAFASTFFADYLSSLLPVINDPFSTHPTEIIGTGTWKILIISTIGIALSFTRARRIPGSHNLAMAMIYLFVARMGAVADLEGLAGQAPWFLLGAFIWIFIHGAFILVAAKIFRVDIHTAAIASAANIGGAASAPVVAAHHNEILVPVSILMALVGYAIGNYAATLTGILCKLLAG